MSRNPDIQRLLANLRNTSSTPPATENGESANAYRREHTAGVSSVPGQLSSHYNGIPGLALQSATDQYNPKPSHAAQHHPQSEAASFHASSSEHAMSIEPQSSPTILIPDPSTITTWPAALKHITKHVATNPKAAQKIMHLISEQHKHERQWWAARQDIVSRHASRVGNQQKAADLLKSLGGVARSVTPLDPDAEKTELEAYDRKVYKIMTVMAADFDRQLRGLGVPFFAIKHELVISEKGKNKQDTENGRLRLDKGELRELQKRMIQMLEDLFGDD